MVADDTARWKARWDWLRAHAPVIAKGLFSLLALSLLALHLFTRYKLDYVAVLLAVLVAAPWLLDRVERLKAGDWELDLRDLRERLKEVQEESVEAVNELPPTPQMVAPQVEPARFSTQDFATLAFEMRLAIEMLIRELSTAASIGFGGDRVSLTRALRRLSDAGVLPRDLAASLADLIPALNQGVHGERVEPHVLERIAVAGQDTIDSLSRYVSGFKAQSTELVAAMQGYVGSATADRVDYRVSDVRWARDHEGVWWATALIDGINIEIEQALVIMKKEPGGSWTGVDFGTGVEEGELPAEVRPRLWSR